MLVIVTRPMCMTANLIVKTFNKDNERFKAFFHLNSIYSALKIELDPVL